MALDSSAPRGDDYLVTIRMTSSAPQLDAVVTPLSGFLRTMLDSLSDGVYLTDRKRRVVYWNRAAQEITGYEAEEILGKRCSDDLLVHVDERGEPMCGPSCPLSLSL